MKLNALKPKAGSKTKKLIVGRGNGSGKGKTCGAGQKGQKARSGVALKGFEGGQMPLDRRLPKRGFRNTMFARNLAEVSLEKIQTAIEAKMLDTKNPVDEDALVRAGVIRRKKDGVKLLASGELKSKIELKITKASKAAQEAVEKAGGKIEYIVKEVAPIAKRGEGKQEKQRPSRLEKKAASNKTAKA